MALLRTDFGLQADITTYSKTSPSVDFFSLEHRETFYFFSCFSFLSFWEQILLEAKQLLRFKALQCLKRRHFVLMIRLSAAS